MKREDLETMADLMENETALTQNALRRLSDLIAMKNHAEREITHLIGMTARPAHVGAFICARIMHIGLQEVIACPFPSGVFLDDPLKGSTVRIFCISSGFSLENVTTFPATDYFLFLGGKDMNREETHSLSAPWTIRSIFLLPRENLMPPMRKRGSLKGVPTLDSFPDDSQLYPHSKCPLLELAPRQQRLLDLFL